MYLSVFLKVRSKFSLLFTKLLGPLKSRFTLVLMDSLQFTILCRATIGVILSLFEIPFLFLNTKFVKLSLIFYVVKKKKITIGFGLEEKFLIRHDELELTILATPVPVT